MFRISVFFLFLLLNLFAYLAARRAIVVWVSPPERRHKLLKALLLALLLINIPLGVFFIGPAGSTLNRIPPAVLRIFFYPSTAWLATILFFFIIAGPPA